MSKEYIITNKLTYSFTAENDLEAETVFGLYAENGQKWLGMELVNTEIVAEWNPSLVSDWEGEGED
jgi:hypothetical protein